MTDKFIVKGNLGGYYNSEGKFIVCEEYGLTDADLDRYAVQVQNGDGYYNSEGKYVSYNLD
jgi:hypothetical protein